MEDIKKVLGRNIRKYREQMEWSQSELAEKIDISVPFMNYIEHGTRGASVETIAALAVTFGIPYSALFEESCNEESSESKVFQSRQFKKNLLLSISKDVDEFLEKCVR